MPPELDLGKCIGCGVCARVCPASVFRLVPCEVSSSELKGLACEVRHPEKCTECGRCTEECLGKALG